MHADQCPLCKVTIIHASANVTFTCPSCKGEFLVASDGSFHRPPSTPWSRSSYEVPTEYDDDNDGWGWRCKKCGHISSNSEDYCSPCEARD